MNCITLVTDLFVLQSVKIQISQVRGKRSLLLAHVSNPSLSPHTAFGHTTSMAEEQNSGTSSVCDLPWNRQQVLAVFSLEQPKFFRKHHLKCCPLAEPTSVTRQHGFHSGWQRGVRTDNVPLSFCPGMWSGGSSRHSAHCSPVLSHLFCYL